jgi:hypothetical protein
VNTTLAVFATGIVVVAGKWAKSEKLDVKTGVGLTFLALFLSIMDGPAPQVARGLAALVFLSALFTYGTAITGVVQ